MNRKADRETLINSVLPQQVPDAEVLHSAVLEDFGLLAEATVRLPDLIAYSQEHSALFFIDLGAMDSIRLADLKDWSSPAHYRRVFVSVFSSRKEYTDRVDDQARNTHVWFSEEPKHHVFISGSSEASAEFLSARFATG